jgi:hypothetical protein
MNSMPNAISVASLKKPAQIAVAGFAQADESAHMIEWLGKGRDFRKFVANDIEAELYAQDPGAQLLSVQCVGKPEYVTKLLRQDDEPQKGILTQFSVTFPLNLQVRAANGVVWSLSVRHSYHASDLHIPGKHKLRLNFMVEGQAAN